VDWAGKFSWLQKVKGVGIGGGRGGAQQHDREGYDKVNAKIRVCVWRDDSSGGCHVTHMHCCTPAPEVLLSILSCCYNLPSCNSSRHACCSCRPWLSIHSMCAHVLCLQPKEYKHQGQGSG
jgi:hypothetical protein